MVYRQVEGALSNAPIKKAPSLFTGGDMGVVMVTTPTQGNLGRDFSSHIFHRIV